MEQAIFRTIVEMAWEMGLAEEKQEAFLIYKPDIARLVDSRPSKKNQYEMRFLKIYSDGTTTPCYYYCNDPFPKYNIISPVPTSPYYTLCYHTTVQYLAYNAKTRSKDKSELYEKLCDMAIEMVKRYHYANENILESYEIARSRVRRWEKTRKAIIAQGRFGSPCDPQHNWTSEKDAKEDYEEAYLAWKCYENFFHEPKK
jgi:hypothetical protein